MKIKINGLVNSLSSVRGIGSYNQMLKESLTQYGSQHDLSLCQTKADVHLITDFNPYQKIKINRTLPQVVVIHDLIPIKYRSHFPVNLQGQIKWWYNRRLIKQIKGVITDSKVVKQELVQALNLKPSQVEVVYPAAKKIFENARIINKPRKIFNLPVNYLLYTGDVTWNKNLPRLAKAIKRLNLTLVLAGAAFVNREYLSHPWQRSFREFLAETENDQRFQFLGYVQDEDLLWLYQNAKAIVLPSIAEGFGLSWLEASWQKTPVVVGQTKVSREIMGEAACFVDPLSVSSISSGIESVISATNNVLLEAQKKRVRLYTQASFVASFKAALYNLL